MIVIKKNKYTKFDKEYNKWAKEYSKEDEKIIKHNRGDIPRS